MKVFMYDAVPNFGDMLNKYIWAKYFGKFIDRDDGILMFGIGTVLGEDTGGAVSVIVCLINVLIFLTPMDKSNDE